MPNEAFPSQVEPTGFARSRPKRCKLCGSVNQKKFVGELKIRCPGLKNITSAPVCIFRKLTVCLDCGILELVVLEDELRVLARDATTPASIGNENRW